MILRGIKSLCFKWLNWKVTAKVTSTILCITLASLVAPMVMSYINTTKQMTQQIGEELVNFGDQAILRRVDQVDAGVKVLKTLAKTPSLVAAVEEANLQRADLTAKEIAALDEAWVSRSPTIDGTVAEITGNELSYYLIDFVKSNPAEVEVFVTDIKGLNIAMTDRTSDFLQGNEGWWKATYADGNGAIYIGDVEYDDSSKSYAMNLGVPIREQSSQKVIGILRGTLNISIMIETFGNVSMSGGGSIALIDKAGSVLYSHNLEQIMQPAPQNLLALFDFNSSGWTQTTDMDGDTAIVAYILPSGDTGKALGWCLLVNHKMNEILKNQIMDQALGSFTTLIVITIGFFITTMIINNSIVTPLGIVTKMARALSVGDLVRDLSDEEKNKLRLRKDELGDIGKAFDHLIRYMQKMSVAATAIANNNLTIMVTPNSAKDELGNAFAKMLADLQAIIGRVAESANSVTSAAAQLAAASEQSGESTRQISATIHQVAQGTAQQTSSITKTSASVEQMNRAIDGVAKGAREQAKAIDQASAIAARINSAIEQVSTNVQSVTRDSAVSAKYSRDGARTVQETISGMEAIRGKVGLSANKVAEMAANSSELTQSIENIASVSEENSVAVEEVSASTQEVAVQVGHVSASAASMMKLAQDLQNVVTKFKINMDTPGGQETL